MSELEEKLGAKGEKLAAYIGWLRDRILNCRLDDEYAPVMHIDVYGTIGALFGNNNYKEMADYIAELEEPHLLLVKTEIEKGKEVYFYRMYRGSHTYNTLEMSRLISGTAYGDYAIENTFLRDDKTFIEKKTGNCTFVFSMIYKDNKLGVWRSFADGKFWVSSDVENFRSEYALTKADHTPNTMLLTSLRQSNAFKMFTDAFQNGYLFFETINIKNLCFEIMKMYFRY